MSNEVRIVVTTAPDTTTASELAQQLLADHLIACCNIIQSVRSIYRFEGRIHDEAECILLLKTTPDRAEQVLVRIAELHPYQVPEGLVLSTTDALAAYGAWVMTETRGGFA